MKITVKDSQVQLEDIATVVDGNITLKPQDNIEDVIEDKSAVEMHFIEQDATQTELDPEDLKTSGKGNAYYYEGVIKPAIGKYPLVLKVEYKTTEMVNGDEKTVTVKNEMAFTMTVADKPLSISAEGELSAETPISNVVEDIELTGNFKIKVKKSSFSPGGWTLSAKMSGPFEDSQGNSGYPLSLVYYKAGVIDPIEVTDIKIDTSDEYEKEYDFSEATGENFFRIRTGKASSSWASKGETYSATITWDLAGSQSKALGISNQLTAKGK